jgi:hypothetical protein
MALMAVLHINAVLIAIQAVLLGDDGDGFWDRVEIFGEVYVG